MKTRVTRSFVILFAVFIAVGTAFGASMPTHAIIEVKGLACPFCVQGLEKHLKKLDAVAAVQTSLKQGEAVVNFKSGRSASEEELRRAVKRAGFTAGKIHFEVKTDDASASEDAARPEENPKGKK